MDGEIIYPKVSRQILEQVLLRSKMIIHKKEIYDKNPIALKRTPYLFSLE
jgi:hypothetical protein